MLRVSDERAVNLHPVPVPQRGIGRYHPAEYPHAGPSEVNFWKALQDARTFDCLSRGRPAFDLEREQDLPVTQRIDDLNA